MSEAFQMHSSFYFCGESQARRAENWILFKEAWMLALQNYNITPKT